MLKKKLNVNLKNNYLNIMSFMFFINEIVSRIFIFY